ncbi:hypothetical protein [Sneathiella glossodoripedis]|uniref:hypothetical protein n=1 Tax=Sneathiella glossodoripedis TaxID=418853 RepID=UPI000471B05D|nr:hypothetical protein [Sneathiella glossodoripedis]
MLEAAIPDYEEQRLEALRKLRLWKSADDEALIELRALLANSLQHLPFRSIWWAMGMSGPSHPTVSCRVR